MQNQYVASHTVAGVIAELEAGNEESREFVDQAMKLSGSGKQFYFTEDVTLQ
jgi:hypothetical protein